ncbi:type I restriction enzyme subunit R domain-containing protein [Synechococcus elongatus]|uniref:type I restriction enzyme subunit R domain-containing protein n=1 Tax=Synechococcus elongatus TaxID=32046 RepID=UPI003CC8893F
MAKPQASSDELQIVLARDMWLTSFDAPYLATLYIEKPIRGANLTQAIASSNSCQWVQR